MCAFTHTINGTWETSSCNLATHFGFFFFLSLKFKEKCSSKIKKYKESERRTADRNSVCKNQGNGTRQSC